MADEPSVFPGFDRICADPVELIDSLVRQRRALGLSQTEVAARMGTSQSALARLESGRSDVRMSTVARYAEAVDADVEFTVRARPTASTALPVEAVPFERGDDDVDDG